ncbi:DUF802 domain-containing protein [Cupriavidus oxalaticus]|uniref:DUF802 domain-containing protein n=2 Tax=Cupriavidus oxalaticus TaxID=96344 RepID=A0A375GEJ6_9BURK|nr:DUF802 domain-containing protein [Cupriavidus oxalaticus]QRQ84167.1 DUF802 domain-containing protein [Cupriavidus oxalaticus]QRQ91744.1 DUF802 domain-containing protein [Cupriavidus oxalaticus]WQD86330.1 DUF802 domain-containing protein [Cupriavidus oxalaticus]SPC17853.1 conserved membrane hypothetical protein [Cupriavidus oxalaticus]
MNRYFFHLVVFLAGLAAVCWIAAGYAGSNALALSVTLLIGACYVAGAHELMRYRQGTLGLAQAVQGLSEAPASLDGWLVRLPAGLRNAVRLRVEGERVALPGPALTPYLVGLLVLLGMLGTFLGMVSTLRGTGMALETATDLQAIRASLAAPVKGLGFAFGTSVAGVATSAMLGLLSALCRRERVQAAQALDARIATTLRLYSRSHQRDESFRLLQRQADAMPALVDRLQAMMATMEQQNQAMAERLAASQEAFHGKTEAVYTQLAASVGQSLKDSVADSARAAGTAIQPAVEATMAGLARETAAMRDAVTQSVQQQLEGISARFETSTAGVAGIWNEALASQQRSNEALTGELRGALDGFAQAFEQRSAGLIAQVAARLETTSASTAQAWTEALSQHARTGEKLAADNQQALAAATAAFEQQAVSLVRTVGQSHADLQAGLASHDEQRLAAWAGTLGSMTEALRQQWDQASAQAASRQQEICTALAQTANDISAQSQAHASGTIAEIDRLVQAAADAPKAALALQAELSARDEQRLAAWTDALGNMAAGLRGEWEQASAQAASRQQEICAALAQTASDISAQSQAHASGTIAEIDRLVQAAADAPKAALALQTELSTRDEQRLAAWTEALAAMAATLRQEWQQAGAQTATRQQEICAALAQTAQAISTETQAHASGTLAEIERLVQAAAEAPRAAAALQAELAARDEQRLAAWTGHLDSMAASLREQWEQAGSHSASRQQEICDTLAQTARDITAQAEAHASSTIAEVARLMQASAEAPRAAAEVIAELRQKLTEGMARDNAMLEERSRMLETLGTLLDAVNHASTGQRAAVDTLLATTSELLERVGGRFTEQVESETGRLAQAAAQVTGSAVEVASLGEAFGVAVQMFSASNDKLSEQLQRIEAALDKSMARSDEQLAYYVAQAREVVDLSMLSQKQILEDLQQLGGRQAARAEAA